MQRLLSLALVLAAVVALLRPATAAGIRVDSLKAFDCPVATGYEDLVAGTTVLRCGLVRTGEGPDGLGMQIDLAVMVLMPADRAKAARTPTVFLHGGPGGGVIDGWWSVSALKLAREAPLVLFDQRAAGRSRPRLCAFLDRDDPTFDTLGPQALHDRGVADMKKCAAELRERRRDPAAYGTLATVRDMEVLRRELGIETWNIYGVSYGTTVALAYLAAHPERVSAAIIDSVYPPEMRAFSSVLPDFMASFEAMNRACASQPRCRARFGDLRTLLDEALTALERRPLAVLATKFDTYDQEPRHISATTLTAMVTGMLLQSNQWNLVPLVLADVRDGTPSPLVNAVFSTHLWNLSLMSNGAYWATECFERAPFDDEADLARQAASWPALARVASVRSLFALCAEWPAKAAANWATPRNAAPPALVLGGEWDPVTPAAQARETAARLGPNARLLVVPKAAHGVTMMDPCIEGIVAAFAARPAAPIDAACIAVRRDPVFATRVFAVDQVVATSPTLLPATSWLFLAGLLSALAWPAAWVLGQRTTHAPLWRRSAFWLATASMVTVASVGTLAAALLATPDTFWTWASYGIPVEEWPAFSAFLFALPAAAVGAVLLARELSADALTTTQVFHRAFVLTSLGVFAFSLWQLGLLAQLPDLALDDGRRLLGL